MKINVGAIIYALHILDTVLFFFLNMYIIIFNLPINPARKDLLGSFSR